MSASPSAPPSGFSARVEGVQLSDLIQMNCTSRGRTACRVSSRGLSGQLFFEEGRIVHASFGNAVGIEAVAHMLALGTGSFEACALQWPSEASVDLPGDVLLLYAAQMLDELRRSGFRLPSAPPPSAAQPDSAQPDSAQPGSAPQPSAGQQPVPSTPPERSGTPGPRRTRSGTFLYRGKRY
jgi:hypothetical protein